MDEVGRGTTVEDGLAIAFATVHHLNTLKCRALFATHFHELADMLGQSDDCKGQGSFNQVGFFCTGVDETDVSFVSVLFAFPSHPFLGWLFYLLVSTETGSESRQPRIEGGAVGRDASVVSQGRSSSSRLVERTAESHRHAQGGRPKDARTILG